MKNRYILLMLFFVVSLLAGCAQAGATVPMPTRAPVRGEWWRPEVGSSWQVQFNGPLDTTVDAAVYDLDLFETPAETVAQLHAGGRRVMCYISAGSWEAWRPDAGAFPNAVIGRAYSGWPDEYWLDIRQIETLAPLLEARMDLCAAKGFDGIDADNVNGYQNPTGFALTYDDQLAFNTWLAAAAHERGLAIGLKNDDAQVGALLPYFDWALTESCLAEGWCDAFLPFIAAGKPVFAIEYTNEGMGPDDLCVGSELAGFSFLLKERDLGQEWWICAP